MPVAALALLLIACAARAPQRLPFDVRPAMGGLRADVETIAREITTGRIVDAPGAAARVAALRLSLGFDAETPSDFQAYERALSEQARVLEGALVAGDTRHAGVALSMLLDRCDVCHDRYRAGGAAGSSRWHAGEPR